MMIKLKKYNYIVMLILLFIPLKNIAIANETQKKYMPDLALIISQLNLTYLCGEHVTGARSPDRSEPAPHIIWKAYTSERGTASLITDLTIKLELGENRNLGKNTNEGACKQWRFLQGNSKEIIEVCSKEVSGLWNKCSKILPDVKTIILKSSMIH
jgi:hypothetical protein